MTQHIRSDTEASPSVEVRDAGDKGVGVFARRAFFPGEVVIVGKPIARAPERTWLTLQVGRDHHIVIDEPFERVNHSCDPNCGLRANEWGGYDLVAMRAISASEEIAYDYCMSEWVSIAIRGECRCGAATCRRAIRGGKFLPEDVLARYTGFLARYYDEMLREPAPPSVAPTVTTHQPKGTSL